MLSSNINLTGQVTVSLNNNVIREINNIVVTSGKNYVADRMKNNSTVMSHMATGTGTTAASAGQTALVSEAGRVALASTGISGAVVTYTATFPAGTATGALTEAAVLNASSGGTMLCRTVFSAVNKGANDAMTITWTITAS